MDERTLYHETCRYVERVQEISGQTLSVKDWEWTVQKIVDGMMFLVTTPSSASREPT